MSTPESANSSEGQMIRIVLADDQPLVLDGIATILDAQPGFEVVGRASTGREAVEVVTATSPDVVCMDIEMPQMNGIEATAEILGFPAPGSAADDAGSSSGQPVPSSAIRDRHGVQVIMLTTFNREDYLLQALQAGASGFLLKTATPEQLAEGIRSVASGDALLAPEVTRSLIKHAVAESAAPTPPPASPSTQNTKTPDNAQTPETSETLTAREREVLALAALGLSNTEIGEQLFIGAETVKTHMSNVLMKLDLRNRVQAVAYAYQNGIMTPGAASP